MPTYEYRCKDCSHTFDAYQAFTDDALTVCPECAGTLKKLFGNVGIAFKGSGFYKTDSRSKAKGASSSNGESGSSDAKETAASSSDGSSSSSDSSSDGSSGGSGGSSKDSGSSSTPKKDTSSSSAGSPST